MFNIFNPATMAEDQEFIKLLVISYYHMKLQQINSSVALICFYIYNNNNDNNNNNNNNNNKSLFVLAELS